MRWEISRRKALKKLNNTYIYGRFPLLHSIVFLVQLIMVFSIVARFNAFYAKKPLLTTMVTNGLLGGVADTVAQGIGAYRARNTALPVTEDPRSFISSGVELEDLSEKPVRLSPSIRPKSAGPPSFDFERLTRFMSYGFLYTPIQFQWYGFMSRAFPLLPGKGTTQALKRVALDQLIMAPIGLAAFFSYMTITEGGGKTHLVKKFQDIYVPTLRANYILWPMVQMINFRLMPLQFQIPFVSLIGIAWTAYLSLTNSSEDEALMDE